MSHTRMWDPGLDAGSLRTIPRRKHPRLSLAVLLLCHAIRLSLVTLLVFACLCPGVLTAGQGTEAA